MAVTAYVPARGISPISGLHVVVAVDSTPSESRVFAETIDYSRAKAIADALNATL